MKEKCGLCYDPSFPECLMDIFLPDAPAAAAYLYFHGGGLESGSREGLHGLRDALLNAGIAYISADYRLYPAHAYPAFLEDAARAAAYVIQNASALSLPKKLFIGGSSAGAYLAMMLFANPAYLAAHSLCPKDIQGFVFDAGQPTTHFNVLKYRGENEKRALIDETSALYHVSGREPAVPLLLLTAGNDMPCRLEQNLLFKATLMHNGYDPSLIAFDVLNGFEHCGYLEDPVYPPLIRNFILSSLH